MKNSMTYLLFTTLLFINCGNEPKVNSVSENITPMEQEVKPEIVNDDSSTTITSESTSVKETKTTENKTQETKAKTSKLETILSDKDKVLALPVEKVVQDTIETTKTIVETPEVVIPEFKHQAFDELLRKYVTSNGNVNYKGFKTEITKLNSYIKELDKQYANYNSWSKNKQLAFWINVYNAHTIKLITDNYPVSSITKIKGGKPWDYKFIKLGDKTYTLNEVENEIIRPKFKEPRIHFAVNCAAKSCPKLMNKAWTEDNLNSSLTTQTKAFLANSTENQLSAKQVKLSKIFEWYNVDFTDNGSLISFINKYSSTTVSDNAKVLYNEYNWELNE